MAGFCGSVVALGVACWPLPDNCETTLTCPRPLSATDASTEPPLPPTPACDASSDDAKSGCGVDEKFAVFVAPNGNDETGDGSRSRPFASLSKAADAAKAANKDRVFQCAGTYDKPESLGPSADGLRIYGGLDCATWAYTGAKVVIAPRTQGPALILDQLSTGIKFDDFEFASMDADAPGRSSIAVQVISAKNVVFRRTTFRAGRGADGASAQSKPQATYASRGNNASGVAGALFCENKCATGSSIGGKGGDSGGGNAEPGLPDRGGVYPNNGGVGADSKPCSSGGAGGQGVAGPGGHDEGGATKPGAIISGAWVPASGAPGTDGAIGQGGGGGGARTGAGGGGGCGGCGGSGGGAGGGGGGSIALLAIEAAVSLEACVVTAAAGGHGGAGAEGQLGQIGGGGGSGASVDPFPGCDGGDGAPGGNGGAGGGGAGGISAGILYSGAAPHLDEATTKAVTIGPPGNKGRGGRPDSNDGVPGVAVVQLDVSAM